MTLAATQLATPTPEPSVHKLPAPRRWRPRSIALIVLAWLVLYIGGLFTPGLLDDVDSIYIEIARQMLVRHDYVTPFIDGIRFFDKPPLMYWLAAGSMRLFGAHDWAGRLPLALLTLGLLLATYALALRLFANASDRDAGDRAALYSALALATCIGPYLYTRFYIPDVVVALWMTVAVHAFLVALERICMKQDAVIPSEVAQRRSRGTPAFNSSTSPLLPCLAFSAATALNVLTKGFIGLVFPLGFAFFYLAMTRRLRLLPKFHLVWSTLVFLVIAAPWHILAALRNPPIAMPSGLGLPPRAGWAWFYLYNEHIARFLSRRIPHDYGQVPIPVFWLLAAVWVFPWVAFLPGAARAHARALRDRARSSPQRREAALTLLLWTGLVMGFFTVSARQEYYSLPCLPALALMAGGLLAAADREARVEKNAVILSEAARSRAAESKDPDDFQLVNAARTALPRMRAAKANSVERTPDDAGAPFIGQWESHDGWARRSALFWHKWLLAPIGSITAAIALFFAATAPHVDPHTDLAALLNQSGGAYNLSLSHLFDLTGRAMGLFRVPLLCFGVSMAVIGPGAYLLRRQRRTRSANLALAAAAACLLLCIHAGLVRFYPTLGSKSLAGAILTEQHVRPEANDLIAIDGEMTSGSTLIFYTRQQVHLVNGRINGPWFGSLWPDTPQVFESDDSLRRLWAGRRRIFLLTYHADKRIPDLAHFGPVRSVASLGGKTVLTNQP